MRGVVARLHRWLGLAAALWLFVLSLSGAAIAFREEADRALNPSLFAVTAGISRTLAQQAATAEASRPASSATLIEPGRPGEPTAVWLKTKGEERRWQVLVDPATARVLGGRAWGEPRLDRLHLMPFLFQLHHDLLLGDVAETALGVLALGWVLLQLLALKLAFPNRRRWRDSFTVHGSTVQARRFRWHRALGLWALPVTLMLAVTGGSFHLKDLYRGAVGAGPPDRAAALARPMVPTAPAVGWDRAAAAGGTAVDRIGYDAQRGLYRLRLRDPRDAGSKGQRDLVLDAATGAVLLDRHRRDGTAGDAFMAWQYPLHSGEALGLAGKLLVMVAGIATATLVALGVRLWLRRTAALRHKARRFEPGNWQRAPAGAGYQPAE